MTDQYGVAIQAHHAGDISFVSELTTISVGAQARLQLVNKNGSLAVIKNHDNVDDEMRELAILKIIQSHKNIVKLLESFSLDMIDNSYIGIPLEYITGRMLGDLIYDKNYRIPIPSIGKYAYLIGEALDHCHRLGVVHRDVKAENVMITDTGSVKLIDFGMSHSNDIKPLKGVVGTPIYMAPETLRREAPGPGVDIWALGVIMFECFAKRPPFGSRDDDILMQNILNGTFDVPLTAIPIGPRALIKRLLEVDVNKRISLKNFAASQWIMQVRSRIFQNNRLSTLRQQQLNMSPPALRRRIKPQTPIVARNFEGSGKTMDTPVNSNVSVRTDVTQIATPPKQKPTNTKTTPTVRTARIPKQNNNAVASNASAQVTPTRANRPQSNPKRPAWRF